MTRSWKKKKIFLKRYYKQGFVKYWYFIWSAGWCQIRRRYSFYFCWWFITNDPWIVILITNKIRFSISFRLIKNDVIIFHRFKSFQKLTLVNRCFCYCDMIEDSFLVKRCLFLFLRWLIASMILSSIFNLYVPVLLAFNLLIILAEGCVINVKMLLINFKYKVN